MKNDIFKSHGITKKMFAYFYEQNDVDRFIAFCIEFEIDNRVCVQMIQAAYGQRFFEEMLDRLSD